ncbi:MAG: hypothetical protein IT269_02070 [Saprospiraceae bacterium]|nr:hypothetical protein [Saprospiraceae bacterium]
MSAEKWSAVLEILSFFLVTIDLFGEKRLIELQKRINKLADRFKKLKMTKTVSLWFFSEMFDEETSVRKPITFSGIVARFLLGFFYYLLGVFLYKVYLNEYQIWWFWSVLLAIFSVGIFQLAVGLIVSVIVRVFEFLIDSFLSGIIYLTSKFELQGLMLVTGAILFMVSKGIILLASPTTL